MDLEGISKTIVKMHDDNGYIWCDTMSNFKAHRTIIHVAMNYYIYNTSIKICRELWYLNGSGG